MGKTNLQCSFLFRIVLLWKHHHQFIIYGLGADLNVCRLQKFMFRIGARADFFSLCICYLFPTLPGPVCTASFGSLLLVLNEKYNGKEKEKKKIGENWIVKCILAYPPILPFRLTIGPRYVGWIAKRRGGLTPASTQHQGPTRSFWPKWSPVYHIYGFSNL